MFQYKCCDEVTKNDVYSAFTIGFSDYMIKLNSTQEEFEKRFFGPEGNQLQHSFIAYDGIEPVGLVLGGIRIFRGKRTLRCGTLCISPDYRGKGIAEELMRLHFQVGKAEKCDEYFLEVIKGNDRAVNFYHKLGYLPSGSLRYYQKAISEPVNRERFYDYDICMIDFETFEALRDQNCDIQVNWQNEIDAFRGSERHRYFAAFDANQMMLGVLALSIGGKIEMIFVDRLHLRKGIGRMLIEEASEKLAIEKLYACVPDLTGYEQFLIHTGFTKDPLEQYEMNKSV